MDIKYIKEVTSAMHEFMVGHNFSADYENSVFKSESKVYKVEYNDAKKVFSVSAAAIYEDGAEGEYKTLSSWYFNEESHGANDTNVLQKILSVQLQRITALS